LNKQLKDMAKVSNFTMNSMDIVNAKETAGSEDIYKVSVKGEGSAPVIIKFINSIQSSGELFVIDTINMSFSGRELQPRSYIVDIVVSYYNIG